MKVLSLLQPWASLVVTNNPFACYGGNHVGIKQWETRSWRPKDPALIRQLQTEGLLIHASATYKPQQKLLLQAWPFTEYKKYLPGNLPTGAIIGHVKIGEICTTEQWISNSTGENERNQEEYRFGDYSPGRFAWQLLTPQLFAQPIPAKGTLGFWDHEFTLMQVN